MAEAAPRSKDRKHEYTHGFFCYGAPLSVKVKFRLWKDVAKEGKRKRYCRQCVLSAVRIFREALVKELKEMGMR